MTKRLFHRQSSHIHPDWLEESEMKTPIGRNPYGKIITQARLEAGLTEKNLSDICLTSPQFIKDVEAGKEWFSEAELSLACSALDLNAVELLKGNRKERTSEEALRKLLTEFNRKLDEIEKIQKDILKEISFRHLGTRFMPTAKQTEAVKLTEDQPAVYVIYDNETGEMVKDDDGNIREFASLADAYAAAEKLKEAALKGVREKVPDERLEDPARKNGDIEGWLKDKDIILNEPVSVDEEDAKAEQEEFDPKSEEADEPGEDEEIEEKAAPGIKL